LRGIGFKMTETDQQKSRTKVDARMEWGSESAGQSNGEKRLVGGTGRSG